MTSTNSPSSNSSSPRPTDCGDATGDVQVARVGGAPRIRVEERTTAPRAKRRTPVTRDEITAAESLGYPGLGLTTLLRAMSQRSALRTWVSVFALATLAACRGTTTSEVSSDLTPAQQVSVNEVRTATSRFQDITVAKSAGYTSQYPAGCAASADGAQGFHYLNESLVDAKVELLKPELVMYEPQADGSMKLIGVDYIVPFTQWTSAEPPMLLGKPFMRNEPLGVWALHIWAFRANPRGTFAMWNPSASCANASARAAAPADMDAHLDMH